MRIYFPVLLLAVAVAAHGQNCLNAVCNASSPSHDDVLNALPSPNNTNSTVTVNIPGGTSAWNAQLRYEVPSAIKELIIQGQTTVDCTGDPGTASYACTATDRTVIRDSYGGNDYLLAIVTGAASSKVRVTGLTIGGGQGGGPKYRAVLFLEGASQNVRLDHDHFDTSTYSPAQWGQMVEISGRMLGVADHNYVELCAPSLGPCYMSQALGFIIFDSYDDDIGNGDGPWSKPSGFGTQGFFFIESSYFHGGLPEDCNVGGRYVGRYNSFNSVYVASRSHGTKSSGGSGRGCRAYESYHNYISGDVGGNAPMGSEGGPALIWGNTLASGYYRFMQASAPRQGVTTESNTPQGWGYCGTATHNPSSGASNGVGSQWDGNQDRATGYPCLDGLGRGQGQALNGADLPNRLNKVTNSISWPHEMLEPIYVFGNTIPSSGLYDDVLVTDNSQNNRDYYFECNPLNPSCTQTFTGQAGTGYGPLANRPVGCKAGPGGTYGTSPTGSYGVAYFAVDANAGQGELFVCTAANTWTNVYQPYQYPHPLVTGGGPPPSGNVEIVVNNIGNGSADGCNGTYQTGQAFKCTLTGSEHLVAIDGCGGTRSGDVFSGTATASCTVTAQFYWRYAGVAGGATRSSWWL